MPIAAWTAPSPRSTTGRDVSPARVASARSRAAIRSARVVSCRIASAAFPVTGAMLAASCSRLAST